MIESIIKVQNQLVNHEYNHPHISHVLGDMSKEIKNNIGVISPESESLLNKIAANFEMIDKNTTSLKQRIDVLE